MNEQILSQIKGLPAQERLGLVDFIYESFSEKDLPAYETAPLIIAELRESIEEFRADPEAGIPFEEFKDILKKS